MAHDAKSISQVWEQHLDIILKEDVRAYPSRKHKQGFSAKAMEKFSPLLESLMKCGGKLLQTTGESSIDILNNNKKKMHQGRVPKKSERFDMWKKEFVTVMRIMMSHVATKGRAYKKSANPRAVEPWLQKLFDLCDDGAAEATSMVAASNAASSEQVVGDAVSKEVVCDAVSKPTREVVGDAASKPSRASMMRGRAAGEAMLPDLDNADDEDDKDDRDDRDDIDNKKRRSC